jgi:hypothetical protein
VLQGLQEAVLTKLDEARVLVLATSVSIAPEILSQQLELVQQLLRVLDACGV